jgi:hypothetical protein
VPHNSDSSFAMDRERVRVPSRWLTVQNRENESRKKVTFIDCSWTVQFLLQNTEGLTNVATNDGQRKAIRRGAMYLSHCAKYWTNGWVIDGGGVVESQSSC